MKSKCLLLFLMSQFIMSQLLFSQNIAINETGNNPDTSAMLDISSTTKGLLTPRLTTTQRNAIHLPAKGLVIYNTAADRLQYNVGTAALPAWIDAADATGQWQITGNSGINPSVNFLGTADNNDVLIKVNNGIKAVVPKNTTIGLLAGDTTSIKSYLASPSALYSGGFTSFNSNHSIFSFGGAGYTWDAALASGTQASPGLPAANALISKTNGLIYDGTGFVNSVSMRLYVDGTPTSSSLPSKISFWTIPSGSKVEAERLTIKNSGSIGINNPSPNTDAALDITATNKGLLPPRLTLTSTASASPLSAHVAGMMVYNTATVSDVVPGVYVNDGTKWNKLSTQSVNLNLVPGDSYTYSATIPYNTWTSTTYLDAYVTPTVSAVPILPVLDGLTLTAQLWGANNLYRPLFRNVSGSAVTFSFTARSNIDYYTTGSNRSLANNTYFTAYDDLYLNTANLETEQIDLVINNKWYRILYFSTLDAATSSGNYTVRINIKRLL